MKKLIGLKKTRSAVFISGTGTNLKNLINFSHKINSPISIEIIISNNKKAKGLKYSNQYKIKKQIINFKNHKFAEKKILKILFKEKINFICLAGFMKILSKNFITNFKYKIINIHPSLLPKFKGLNTHSRVLRSGERYTGCSVHLVNAELDSGDIILQKKVLIKKKETVNSLRKKVLKQEHKLYSEAIRLMFR